MCPDEFGLALSFVVFAAIAADADVIGLVQLAPVRIVLIDILPTVHATGTFGPVGCYGFRYPE